MEKSSGSARAKVSGKGLLPLKDYFALHAYLSSLLCASFIFLPHSTPWFLSTVGSSGGLGSDGLRQSSSADRPEHRFLTPITSQPLATMTWDVLAMLVCMIWWGQRMSRWFTTNGAAKASGRRQNLVGENELAERQQRLGKMFRRVGEAAAATLGVSLVFGVLLFTFGAPLNSHLIHTALFSLHLSLLVVWPVVHTLGIPSIYDDGLNARYRMTRLFCDFRPETPVERALVYPVIGTLVGAWAGAIPIPLDWDRPWQSYPLTPTFASILGFIIGGFASFFQSALEESMTESEETKTPKLTTTTKNRKKKRT